MWASVRKFAVQMFLGMYERFGLSHPLLSALAAFLITGALGVIFWQFLGSFYRASLPKIFLDCHLIHVPIAFPASTTILSLEPRALPNFGFSEYITNALEQGKVWPSPTANEDVYRCELDNRSAEGILKAELAFTVATRAAMPVAGHPTARVSGGMKASYDHTLSIPELRPGKFEFYIRNNLPDFLYLRAPDRLTCEGRTSRRVDVPIRRLGAEEWITIAPPGR